jgi:hypothetical protein
MVGRHDVVLAAIPLVTLTGAVAGEVTGTPAATVAGLLGALLIVGHELFVVGVPE